MVAALAALPSFARAADQETFGVVAVADPPAGPSADLAHLTRALRGPVA